MTIDRAIQAFLDRNPRRTAAMERILRVVTESGPRPKSVILGLSEKEDRAGNTLKTMLAIGLLVPIGKTRSVTYGTPDQEKTRRRRKPA